MKVLQSLRHAADGRALTLAAILTGGVLIGSAPSLAHAFAPALLELRQLTEDTYGVRFKQPLARPRGSELLPILPLRCSSISEVTKRRENTGLAAVWDVRCVGGLAGETVGVDGIAAARANVLLRVESLDGATIRHILTVEEPAFILPAEESVGSVLLSYGKLGFEHILGGFDHLLFVLGLLLLVGGGRRLVLTVTAFTAGHSVTLALAVLGVVAVPQAATEVLIAFSIYLLAVELARPTPVRKKTWMSRWPGSMAGAFGLLHGLGFAGALREAGLPAGDVPAALLAFNGGIEAGQLAFVAVALVVGLALRMAWEAVVDRPLPRPLTLAPVYLIGSLAAFWVYERLAGIIGS